MAVTATGSAWTPDDLVTLTAASAAFVAGNVNDEVWLYDSDGTRVRFTIEVWTSTTVVTARVTAITGSDGVPLAAVPTSLQGVAATSACLAVDSFTGADHLDGETVGVYADGQVLDDTTVSAGALTITIPSCKVTVGLRYNCDLESLQMEIPGDYGSARGARKVISGLSVEVDEWRGLSVGGSLTDLEEVDERHADNNYEPSTPENTLLYVYPTGEWSSTVRVALRQSDPLPVTVLSLIPEIEVGD